MAVPHLAAVLIPLRSLRRGKLRLSDAIDEDGRAALIESMAETVVSAAHELDVFIIHDDDAVAEWALARGATPLQPPIPGLNEAVTFGRDHARDAGYSKVIVAHADLPRSKDLRVLLTSDPKAQVAIVPDRHGDGTNVMCLDTQLEFTFAYGPGSFANHLQIARDLGIEPHIVSAPDLAWDVDHPDDLPPELQ